MSATSSSRRKVWKVMELKGGRWHATGPTPRHPATFHAKELAELWLDIYQAVHQDAKLKVRAYYSPTLTRRIK